MRLLTIEDNSTLRKAVPRYFREAGFIVETDATGDEGLWAAAENPCEAILIDPMLSENDGMEIIRRPSVGNSLHSSTLRPLRRN